MRAVLEATTPGLAGLSGKAAAARSRASPAQAVWCVLAAIWALLGPPCRDVVKCVSPAPEEV